jgi:RimJ/RimL family protein N-acetyltransferase
MKIEKATLTGPRVRLEALTAQHLPGLASAIADGALWELPVTFVPHPDALPEFLAKAEAAFLIGRELAFVTIDIASGAIVGSTRFRAMDAAHKRAEIGFTFIGKSWQRSHVNTEAKYLMLRHAFEHWGCNRVELLTDFLNLPSRAAIVRLGAREEGVLRSHMVMRDGRVRDSVVFSIIAAEWADVKRNLASRMAEGGAAR